MVAVAWEQPTCRQAGTVAEVVGRWQWLGWRQAAWCWPRWSATGSLGLLPRGLMVRAVVVPWCQPERWRRQKAWRLRRQWERAAAVSPLHRQYILCPHPSWRRRRGQWRQHTTGPAPLVAAAAAAVAPCHKAVAEHVPPRKRPTAPSVASCFERFNGTTHSEARHRERSSQRSEIQPPPRRRPVEVMPGKLHAHTVVMRANG